MTELDELDEEEVQVINVEIEEEDREVIEIKDELGSD